MFRKYCLSKQGCQFVEDKFEEIAQTSDFLSPAKTEVTAYFSILFKHGVSKPKATYHALILWINYHSVRREEDFKGLVLQHRVSPKIRQGLY